MLRYLKINLTKFIPLSMQVPLKYWYSFMRGYTEAEMNLLKSLVQKETVAIDIGGNRGIYSYCLHQFCKSLEIFEPNPLCFAILQSWSGSKDDVNVHQVGLSNVSGSAELFIPIDSNGVEHDSSGSIENNHLVNTRSEMVPIKTLDSYMFKNVSFIKIDVEGHEFKLLEGSHETISSSKPAMLIEVEQRHNSQSIFDIFSFLENFGYKVYFLDGGQLLDLSHFDISIHQQELNLSSSQKYINNFLFLHNDRLNNGEYLSLPIID
jgi:FkbM family methyltransferase